jgi:tetratricopeptide (TPR) repeat protein
MNLIFTIIIFLSLHENKLSADKYNPDDCTIYNAYVHNDMGLWETGVEEYAKGYKNTKNIIYLYEVIVAQYGLIAFYIGNKQYNEAENNINKAEENIDILLKSQAYASSAYALKAGINGMKIGIHPVKAVYLGQFNLNYIDASFKLNNNNPLVWMEKGNTAYYAPGIFGGSYSKAADYYKKAAVLFEQEKQTKCNWLYLHCLVWLGKSYEMADNYTQALETYEKILRFEPDLAWVKNTLYPELKNKIK